MSQARRQRRKQQQDFIKGIKKLNQHGIELATKYLNTFNPKSVVEILVKKHNTSEQLARMLVRKAIEKGAKAWDVQPPKSQG